MEKMGKINVRRTLLRLIASRNKIPFLGEKLDLKIH